MGNWVGNQLPAGWDTRLEWGYFQFLAVAYPESKNPVGYYTSTTSGGLAIGHVSGNPLKATDAFVLPLSFWHVRSLCSLLYVTVLKVMNDSDSSKISYRISLRPPIGILNRFSYSLTGSLLTGPLSAVVLPVIN